MTRTTEVLVAWFGARAAEPLREPVPEHRYLVFDIDEDRELVNVGTLAELAVAVDALPNGTYNILMRRGPDLIASRIVCKERPTP